ncbi:MAG: hypothetical protein A4E36_01172 [Methanoregulaceae archaeon PtaB.Bin009]|nr:MAG: hypothetical protein A4E36_01172 [Methanoregulaceae archaeon PtaB.Bin009]OPY38636.1 MAG: hypothetical protein A4E41_01918 [Methanoregulaceae archaeon PtaU1.Bin066]
MKCSSLGSERASDAQAQPAGRDERHSRAVGIVHSHPEPEGDRIEAELQHYEGQDDGGDQDHRVEIHATCPVSTFLFLLL